MKSLGKENELRIGFLVLILSGTLIGICATDVPRQTESIAPPISSAFPISDRPPAVRQVNVINDTTLVDLHSVNPHILLDLRYATKNNFIHKQLYPKARCLLRAGTARRLSLVQTDLEQQGLGLKVYDCYRPLSVQVQMWKAIPDDRYVANPAQGSRHNRGAAVDVTLVDRTGKELEMPTGFDDFSEHAYSNYPQISAQGRSNRQQLKKAMENRGFISLKTEWWHFDAEDWNRFSILNTPLDSIP